MLAKLKQWGSWLTGGEPQPPTKPSWELLKAKIVASERRIVDLFSSTRTRFKYRITSKFDSLDDLDDFFAEMVDNLEKKNYGAIKSNLTFRENEGETIEMDDFLLTKDRRYISGPLLSNRIAILIEHIDTVVTLNHNNFDAKIMIDQYFKLILEEYWQLYVNSLK